jgi:hypothetical protein
LSSAIALFCCCSYTLCESVSSQRQEHMRVVEIAQWSERKTNLYSGAS